MFIDNRTYVQWHLNLCSMTLEPMSSSNRNRTLNYAFVEKRSKSLDSNYYLIDIDVVRFDRNGIEKLEGEAYT